MNSARFFPVALFLILTSGVSGASAAPIAPSPIPAAVSAPVAQGAWSLYYSPPPVPLDAPSFRVLPAAVYDPVGDRMMVFGGLDSIQTFNDTWSLSPSGTWTQVPTVGTAPLRRRDHTAIYDPVRQRMIVFGGSGFFNSYMSDTYALTLTGTPTWNLLTTGGPGRFSHTAIYDPVRDRMIVFGGYNGSFLNDVWQLTLSGTPTWSQIVPSGTPPSARNALTAIYDPVRDRMLLFGGWDGTTFRSDVWALNLSGAPAWSPVTTSGTPPSARRHYAAVYDPAHDRVVISGGEDWSGPLGNTFGLSLSGTPTWSAIAAGGSTPSARSGHRAVLDPARGRMIEFGGYNLHYLNDTYVLSLAAPETWSLIALIPGPTGPTPRRDHVAIYDPVRGRLVIFGGWDGHFLNDTWALSLTGSPAWTPIPTSGTPPSGRFAHTAIYDGANDRLVVFGGYDGAFRNDGWALSLSGTPTWTQVLPAGPAPTGRNAMTAILDPVRQRLVLFGGFDGTAFLDDLWTLNLSGPPAWAEQVSFNGPTPSARRHYAAIYDPPRDEIAMAGGLGDTLLNDAWTLALATSDWRELGGAPHAAPPLRHGHRAVYDTPRGRLVLFGGYGGPNLQYLQDTWALSLSSPRKWSPLSPTGTPPAGRLLHTAIYDPIRDRVIVFGGEGYHNVLFNDTWALDFSTAAPSGAKGPWELDARIPSPKPVNVLALRGAYPNPWEGTEDLKVSFSLPGSDAARLELFSITGHRVLLRDVGRLGAGAHEVSLEIGTKLPPGLYVVRLSGRGGSFVTKVAKLR